MQNVQNTQNNKPFQKINEACRTTGLSAYFLRNGCKSGEIPHIKSGNTYFINIPELLHKLSARSGEVAKEYEQ